MPTVKKQKRPMSFRKKAIIATSLLLLVFAAMFFVSRYQIARKTPPQPGSPIIEGTTNDAQLPGSQQGPLTEVPSSARRHRLPATDRQFLIAQGLQNPPSDIVRDLMKHNELIPCKGALGGTPGFYNPDGITVLSRNHVIADYDDGHVEGTVELTFTVSNGTISWTVTQAECGN